MNNTTSIPFEFVEKIENSDFNLVENILALAVNSIGLVLNLLCHATFSKNNLRHKSRSHLFNYYFYVTKCNLVINIINLLSLLIFYYISNLGIKTILSKVYIFLLGIFTLNTNLLELTATFIRYISINERFKAFREKHLIHFKSIVLAEFLFSVVTSIYLIFQANLINMESLNQLSDCYNVKYDNYVPIQVVVKWLAILQRFVRDILCTFVIFVLNIFMVIQFRSIMAKKLLVVYLKGKKLTRLAKRSQNDVTIMVLFISSKNVCCHFIYFLNYLLFIVSFTFAINKPYQVFNVMLLEFSFCINFFFFFKFNKRFKRNLLLMMSRFFPKFIEFYSTAIKTTQ